MAAEGKDPIQGRGWGPVMLAAWVALGLALAHLVSVLLIPQPEQASAGALVRAVLACLALPVPGLALALLLLKARRPEEPAVGAFTLVALSVGFAMVLYLAAVSILRAVAPPVTSLELSLINMGWAGAAVAAAWPMRRWRIRPEPGLNGPTLGLALAVILILLLVSGHRRVLSGPERMVSLPLEIISEVVDEAPRFSQDVGALKVLSGAKPVGAFSHQATSATIQINLTNKTGGPRPVRLAMILSAPPGNGAALHRLPNSRCGLSGEGAKAPAKVAQVQVEENVLGTPVQGVLPRFNALIAHYPSLEPGDNCFELQLTGEASSRPGILQLRDISHERLGRGIVGAGEFFLVEPESAECHLSDAGYRLGMYHNQLITPQLLLWGYFTQFVAEALAGGAYPAVGVLFLLLALLNFSAGLVLLGAALPGQELRLQRRLAGLLLMGPMASQVLSLVLIRNQSFGFPDGPYTFFLMAALVMLVRGQRVGFILLGCLAAYARYPGAYVLAVALFTWLALEKDRRRWTLVTMGWSVAAGLVVIGLLLAHYHLLTSVKHFLDAVYFEVFPEHFEMVKNGPPAWLRVVHFWLKLTALACLTPLLWPLARGGVAKLLIVVTVAYALTLMSVDVAHSHYFQLLIYASAVAGLSALGRFAKGPRLYAAAGLVLVGGLASHTLVRLAATLLAQWGLDWPLGLK